MGGSRFALLVLAQSSPGAGALQADGANLPVDLYVPSTGGRQTVTAEIDSGSTLSGASEEILQTLGAPAIGTLPVGTPGGNVTDTLYDAQLIYQGVALNAGLPGGLLGEQLPAPVRALIGRDVLQRYEFLYDGVDGQWTLSTQTLAPVPPLASRLWLGVGLVALGAASVLAAEAVERRHLARRQSPLRGRYGFGRDTA